MNHLRLEVYDVYNKNLESYVISGVIRDHERNMILTFGKRIEKPPSVVYVELAAIKVHEDTTDSY